MKNLKRQYKESIIALLRALESINRFIDQDSKEVHEALRRIAHSLKAAGTTYGIAELASEAGWLDEVDTLEIDQLLENLLKSLNELTAKEEEDKLGILIMEDDRTSARLIKQLVEISDREVFLAASTTEGFSYLLDKEIALVILDLNLLDGDGRDFLIHMRSFPGTAMIPVIVLTSAEEAHIEVECLALGADMYIRKPFDPEILAVAVASRLQKAADFSRQSRHDLLTGLPNRAAFVDIYERASSFATRLKEPLSIGIIDLDHFKNVNDNYGHGMGDEVLRTVASVMAESLRKSDQIARWGGEEFVTLFPHTDPAGAVIALNKTLSAIREVKFTTSDKQEFSISFSAGVAQVLPGVLVQDAVADADRLLYLAKAEGRNRILHDVGSSQSLE